MKGILVGACLLAAGAAQAAAADGKETSYQQGYRQGYYAAQGKGQAAAPRELTKKFGIGLATIQGASATTSSLTSSFSSIIATPNAMNFRYWLNEKVALEGQLGLDINSLSTGGATATTPGTQLSSWGLGVGAKLNVSRPSPSLLAQLVARASTASSTQTDPTGLFKINTSTTNVYLGAGFEAFIPGWDWLSIEGSAGFSAMSSQSTPDTSSLGPAATAAPSQTVSRTGIGGSGFSPVSMALHIYF